MKFYGLTEVLNLVSDNLDELIQEQERLNKVFQKEVSSEENFTLVHMKEDLQILKTRKIDMIECFANYGNVIDFIVRTVIADERKETEK